MTRTLKKLSQVLLISSKKCRRHITRPRLIFPRLREHSSLTRTHLKLAICSKPKKTLSNSSMIS